MTASGKYLSDQLLVLNPDVQAPGRPGGFTRVLVLISTMHHVRKKSLSSKTPTNSPPRTPTPPVVEHIERELATPHPRTKDRRALGAAPSAITSPSCDPTDNAPDEPGSSKESAWKTAYGTAKMAFEIANASSDMFLPLKAVVGALSVFIRNYDVSPLWVSHPVGFLPFPVANQRQCGSDQRSRKKDSVASWDTQIPCR